LLLKNQSENGRLMASKGQRENGKDESQRKLLLDLENVR
jgi:hypothetical protein